MTHRCVRSVLLITTVAYLCLEAAAFHLQPSSHSLRLTRGTRQRRGHQLLDLFSLRSSSTRSSNPLQVQLNSKTQDTDEDDYSLEQSNNLIDIIDSIGLVSQPIVWISLYTVATTGAGLPAGPFGVVGAVEGISYLVVVGFALASLVRVPSLKLVESLSWVTLGAGLFTLGVLVAQQGCVPNAKPILDYSAYLPVCNPEETPGFFGG